MFSILKICYAFQGEESCAEPVSTCARLRSASSSGTFPCLARNDAAMLLYNWLPFEINALLALLPSRLPRLGTVHELRALSITTSNQARGRVSISSAMQATADDGHVLVPCRCPSFVCHVQDLLREARGCSILGLDRTVWIFLLGHGVVWRSCCSLTQISDSGYQVSPPALHPFPDYCRAFRCHLDRQRARST